VSFEVGVVDVCYGLVRHKYATRFVESFTNYMTDPGTFFVFSSSSSRVAVTLLHPADHGLAYITGKCVTCEEGVVGLYNMFCSAALWPSFC
jgi:hypothetical protein